MTFYLKPFLPLFLLIKLRFKPNATGAIFIMLIVPVLIVFIGLSGVLKTDATILYAGLTYGEPRKLIAAEPTIEGNYGVTAQALGTRAALDVWHGRLPLWNHYEGLGAPLLGEMQSAALFPPTWLMVLPHGQILEQALLQFLAGVGAFLFFRSFGLNQYGAVAGGLVYEINGVYAWLRNAIFHPVVFLPWLFLWIEWNRVAAIGGLPLRRRLPLIGLGGCIAALSLYAGFPEEVYLYGLLLVAWTVLRISTLSNGQKVIFVTDVLLAGSMAMCLSAPLLVAFVDYLAVAELGGHTADGFGSVWLGPGGLIQYILPYIYGLIFGSKDPQVVDIWSSTGGYIGFVPVVLSIASLATRNQRTTKLFLTTWVVIAIGVTHGFPGIYEIFMLIPLTKSAAVFRYLNVSWIFCFIFLSAIYIHDVAEISSSSLRRTLVVGLLCAYVLVALAIGGAWPLLMTMLTANSDNAKPILLTMIGMVATSTLICLAAFWVRLHRAAWVLSCIFVFESLMLFFIPYLSFPRAGKLDLGLIRYLQDNIGYQRVLNSTEGSITPNYGSYFGISTINYDDLPSPKLTGKYIRENLDSFANPIAYGPFPEGLAPEQQADWKRTFRARLPAFAKAGVKFVLAAADFDLFAPYDLIDDGSVESVDYSLEVGREIEVSGQVAALADVSSSKVSIALQADAGVVSGHLSVTLCVRSHCGEGKADLITIKGNRRLSMPLDRSIDVHPGDLYTIRLARIDGDGHIGLPLYPSASSATLPSVIAHAAMPDGLAPDIRLADDKVLLAYEGRLFDVFKLLETRPYMSADSCQLTVISRDILQTFCSRPSRLTRLELMMEGWTALIDGKSVEIGTSEDVFQTVDLPTGTSRVEFQYEPRHFGAALAVACLALVSLVFILMRRRAASELRTQGADHQLASTTMTAK